MENEKQPAGGRTIKPDPDPTFLTTQQLIHEVSSLKELIFTRLDAMDRAIVLFSDNLTRAPTEVDKQIGHLKALREEATKTLQTRIDGAVELMNEKFANVQTQFKERDVRVEQTARDTKVAVDAALQAAEKAVAKQNEGFIASIAKSDAATTKQIDQQGTLITTSTGSLNDKIDDLKARVGNIESVGVGGKAVKDDSKAMIAIGISVLMGVLYVVSNFIPHSPAPVVTPAPAPQVLYYPAPAGTMLPSPPAVDPHK